MCLDASFISKFLDMLTESIPLGFCTLYPADLAATRVSVSESLVVAISCKQLPFAVKCSVRVHFLGRLRAEIIDRIQSATAVIGDKCIPFDISEGNLACEFCTSESSGQALIIGTDVRGFQWELGAVSFNKS
jgi:hypothetical protein